MKNILLCTDGSSFSENVCRYGVWIAKQFDAHINVLFVTDIRSQKVVSTSNLSGSIGLGASEKLLEELVNLEHKKAKLNNQKARLILQNSAKILEAEGFKNFDLINKTGFLVDCFHEFEENSDLIVLGKRGEAANFASGHLGANVDRIVRSSHKPCFVTPREFRAINRILVAYDGSSTGKKILQFLIESPCFKNLEIHLMLVAKRHEDKTAVANLNEAQQQLNKAGVHPICIFKEGEPENEIATYMTQKEIDLLVMGAYGHRRIRHLVIGSTTAQLLRSSTIPVLLFR